LINLLEDWRIHRTEFMVNDMESLSMLESMDKVITKSNDVITEVNVLDEREAGHNNSVAGRIATEISRRKLDTNGDFKGSWFGISNPVYSEPGIAGVVISHTEQLAEATPNVKRFGAKGDGVTDDTQAFIDYIVFIKENGFPMIIPDGIFVIASPDKLLIDFDIFNVVGNNRYTSIIMFTNPTGGFLFKKPVAIDWIYKVTFDNVTISGDNVCNVLANFESTTSEMVVSNSVFTRSSVSHFIFTDVAGVKISNTDIVQGDVAITCDNLMGLTTDNMNVFTLADFLKVSGSISNWLSMGNDYYEHVDHIIHATPTFGGIGSVVFNDMGLLHNFGSSSPFYFEHVTYISRFIINGGILNVIDSCQYLFDFVIPVITSSVFLKMNEVDIINSSNSLLAVVNTRVTSLQWQSRAIMKNVVMPVGLNIFANDLGMVQMITDDYSTTNYNKGIRLIDQPAYGGLLTYNTVSNKLQVTDTDNVNTSLMRVISCLTADRPTGCNQGDMVYDATLNMPIWWNGMGSWVNSSGIVV